MPAPGFGAHRMSTFRLSTTASACLLSIALLAQVPQAISYQAVVREPASGLPMANTAGTVRFVLHNDTPTGPVVYNEDQAFSANDQGLFTAAIGAMAATTGPFNPAAWSSLVFLEVQLDIGNTGAFTTMGTQQLLSVPFALRSAHSNLPDGTEVGQVAHWNGGAWVVDSGLYVHQKRFGIGITAPEAPLSIQAQPDGKLFSVTGQPTPVGEAGNEQFSLGYVGHGTDSSALSLDRTSANGRESMLAIQQGTGNVSMGALRFPGKFHVLGSTHRGSVSMGVTNMDVSANDGWSLSHLDDSIPSRSGSFMLMERHGSDGTERITVLPGGNVGIGTAEPSSKLHIEEASANSATGLKIRNTSSLSNMGWAIGHLHDDDVSRDGSFCLVEDNWPAAGDLDFNDVALRVMHGGNVGIGSPYPPAMLTVGKRDELKTYFETGDIPTGDDFSFRLTDSTGFSIEQGTPSTSTSRFFIQQGTGHVGIGTTTPLERHHVHAVHHGGHVGMRVSNGAVSSNGGWTLGHVDDEMIPERSGAFALMEAPGSGGGAGGSRMVVMPGGNVGINEVMPYATLHVSKPAADPTEPISLIENTGIAMLGPLEQHLVMDSRSIQARHLLGGATSLTGSAGSLRLQPLGGEMLIHGDATDASRMFMVKDDGTVGVGTVDPTERLHVNGAIVVGNTASAAPPPGTIRFNGIGFEGRTGSGDWAIFNGVVWQKVDNTDMIHYDAGSEPRVGIGTTSPDTRLHVSRDPADPSSLVALQENTGIVVVGPITDNIAFDHQGIQARHLLAGTTSDIGSSGLHLQRLGGDLLVHGDAATSADKVIITSSGNLGLGTLTPSERLHVDGAVVIGDAASTSPPNGTIRWSGTDFEGRSAGEWVPFDAGWRRTVSNNAVHHNARVGIGTSTPASALDVVGQGSPTEGGSAASVGFIDSMVNLLDDREYIGLRVYSMSTGSPGGTRKNIGLYVSEVSGQASMEHNLAAVLNGNTVIGDLHPASSLIGTGGSNVLAIQNGTAPSSAPSSGSGLPDGGVQLWSASDAMGTSVFHVMNGNGDVLSLAKQNPLYAADMSALNPVYDAGTAAIIENMRTRINQLETILKNLGVLEP